MALKKPIDASSSLCQNPDCALRLSRDAGDGMGSSPAPSSRFYGAYADGLKVRRHFVSLDRLSVAWLKEAGYGNLSAGVRRVIREYRRRGARQLELFPHDKIKNPVTEKP